jgi:hypothetical protein
MKIIDNLKNEIDEIHGTILIMQNIIKGLDTPCGLCSGCETEDGHLGVCESFTSEEKLWDRN